MYPISTKHRPTVTLLTGCPLRVSSSAMVRVDLLVHFKGLIGSPAVVSPTMAFSRRGSAGSASSTFFRPPPGALTLPASDLGKSPRPCSSATPLVIVTRDIPVSSDSRLIPPRPSSNAFSATNSRPWYSFKVPSTLNQRRSPGEDPLPRLA